MCSEMPSSTWPMRTITPASGMSAWNTLVQFGLQKIALCTSVPTLRASTSNAATTLMSDGR